ncbi:hypothetical protein BP354A_4794, partial [Burkholderia pseudomallei 354a]
AGTLRQFECARLVSYAQVKHAAVRLLEACAPPRSPDQAHAFLD